jgi:hypothetical protein
MLWMINLSLSLVDKNLKKLSEAKIGLDRNNSELIILFQDIQIQISPRKNMISSCYCNKLPKKSAKL